MTNNNICAYIRTATNDDKAIEAQRVQLHEFAAELSDNDAATTLTEYVDAGYSGLTTERPALEQIKLLAASGQIDVLIMTDPMRLDRNRTTFAQQLEYFDDLGVTVEFISDSSILEEEG